MKKKQFTRHVCILVSDKMFEKIKDITDKAEISISEYFRDVLQEKFDSEESN